MTRALDIALLIATAAVLLPVAVFCAECLLALLPQRVRRETGERPAVVALIPAHNEETGIGRTLETLMPTLVPGDRVLVVADNCTDGTAAVARAAGAEVVERTDATRRGKGYALEFGLTSLAPPLRKGGPGGVASESGGDQSQEPPAESASPVIVFLDADCQVNSDTVDQLARAVARTKRPVQGLNLSIAETSGVQAVSSLGFHFKNLVRPTGLARIGLPCHLMGTGMALPWEMAMRMLAPAAEPITPNRVGESSDATPPGSPFRRGGAKREALGANLVEDMQLGVDLALAGTPTVFCSSAMVTSRLPTGNTAFLSQRTRWEHGHLRTSLTQIPRLLAGFLRRGDLRLLALALDLTVPPFSMLLFACGALWLAAVSWFVAGGSPIPAGLLTGAGILIGAVVLAGWAKFCRAAVPLRALASVPVYMLRKVPIYLAFLTRRGPRAWVRTERDELV
jgi:hypothetical protein